MAPVINDISEIHKGRVFTLTKERITLDNNVATELDIIRHPGASAIIPIRSDDTIILLKQYRHAIGDFLWEIPAGTLEPGEAFMDCAKRELKEETGFEGNNWTDLGKIYPVPGYSDECIHLFMAENLTRVKQDPDEDEIFEVHEITFDHVMDMIYQGEIRDSKTISGVFLAMHVINRKKSRKL